MKTWDMNVQAISNVSVEADSYNEALEKGIKKAEEIFPNWNSFKILLNTVEVRNEKA